MKTYRYRTLLIVIVLALIVAGCASVATPAPTTAPVVEATKAPVAPVTPVVEPTKAPASTYGLKAFEVEAGAKIVFSGWGDETEQKIYRDSIARFAAVYPDVAVDFQPIPADFQTKVKAMMAGGTAPDVLYVDDQLMTAFGASG
ncbi:MAG: hypothetical protein WAV70_09495, partial [Anaerolineae bacterium]